MESDPHGLSQHQPGAKLDAGKIRPQLVLGGFSKALVEVAKVGTFGAAKYTDDGWKDVENGIERYSDAMIRHWLEECGGAGLDEDSGLLHAAHLAWNALARLELILSEQEGSAEEIRQNAAHVSPQKDDGCQSVFFSGKTRQESLEMEQNAALIPKDIAKKIREGIADTLKKHDSLF